MADNKGGGDKSLNDSTLSSILSEEDDGYDEFLSDLNTLSTDNNQR